jgi:hypothetical protein
VPPGRLLPNSNALRRAGHPPDRSARLHRGSMAQGVPELEARAPGVLRCSNRSRSGPPHQPRVAELPNDTILLHSVQAKLGILPFTNNMRSIHLLLTTIAILAIVPAFARSSASRGWSHSPRCSSCARDTRGHIKRSPEAKSQFRRGHPCPATGRTSGHCPGYVIDHVRALKHGGADDPSNMQWQTVAAARAKDRTED